MIVCLYGYKNILQTLRMQHCGGIFYGSCNIFRRRLDRRSRRLRCGTVNCGRKRNRRHDISLYAIYNSSHHISIL